MSARACVLGVFVGGQGKRMGGVSKALLRTPDGTESLVERALRVGREAGLTVVIVGAGDTGAIDANVSRLMDDPSGVGPLGGLAALLAHAKQRDAHAIALACDMPYVSAALLAKLANDPRDAAILCPRDAVSGKWQALFARYTPEPALLALHATLDAGQRSLQALIERAGGLPLTLSTEEHALLRDWDTPQDVC
jgi:molybdopterin-guanine dinucleotide biosynthesis protein A